MSNQRGVTDCFLCGEPIRPGQATNRGHVLPLSFVPKAWRPHVPPPGLVTHPVHVNCNSTMGVLENYVLHDLGKAVGGEIGDVLRADLRDRYLRKPSERKRYEELRKAWIDTGQRVLLPGNAVATPYDGEKAYKVFSAMIRGYFFHFTGRVFRAPMTIRISPPFSRLEHTELHRDLPFMNALLDHPSLTKYTGVLSVHCCGVWDVSQGMRGHGFAVILWDSYAFGAMVLEPTG